MIYPSSDEVNERLKKLSDKERNGMVFFMCGYVFADPVPNEKRRKLEARKAFMVALDHAERCTARTQS